MIDETCTGWVPQAARPGRLARGPSGGALRERPSAVCTRSGPATGTIVLLTRLARAVYLRSSVDLVGMNLRNMVVLAYLRDHPGASQQAMAEDLSMDSNTGVLVLNDLEDLEYAERRRDPSDRRRHLVDITDAGLEALERAEIAQGSIEDEILGGLSAAERATLRAAPGEGARGPPAARGMSGSPVRLAPGPARCSSTGPGTARGAGTVSSPSCGLGTSR